MKFVSMFMILCVAIAATAGIQKAFSVPELVDQYYATPKNKSISLKLFSSARPDQRDCHERPDTQACVDFACKKLGSWQCDDMNEINAVSRACRGNYGSACLEKACQKIGSWQCDDINEITEVARACVGNYDTGCFENVCTRLGSWQCDDIKEITEVLRSCAGHD